MNVFHTQSRIVVHKRFSELMERRLFQVVYPVLPIDFLGLYVIFPE